MSVLLHIVVQREIKESIKLSTILMGLLYIIEVIYAIIIKLLFNFDRFANMANNNITTYVMFIVLKILELFLLFAYTKTKERRKAR